MTREEAKEILPLIQAYANGETIQFLYSSLRGDEWIDQENPNFDVFGLQYRIKPVNEVLPFTDVNECWKEMLNHQPFGWVREKDSESLISLQYVCAEYISFGEHKKYSFDDEFHRQYMLSKYEFVDGCPFGKSYNEEE